MFRLRFERSPDGRETIHVGDTAVARVVLSPSEDRRLVFEHLSQVQDVTEDVLQEASILAMEHGFWNRRPATWHLLRRQFVDGPYMTPCVEVEIDR